MNNHDMKQYTEPIFARLAEYRAELAQHPLLTAARGGRVSEDVLREFAFHQYSDSILWIPMLAQMRAKAPRSARLRRAIEDNIAHEAGLSGISHVTLTANLLRSLGISSLAEFPAETFAQSAELWLSEEFHAFCEPEIAGFLLTAETLVPQMFSDMRPAYEYLGCDTRYFDEHVAVDGDEHAVWMREAVFDVLAEYGEGAASAVMVGMADAWEETLEVPNALWRDR